MKELGTSGGSEENVKGIGTSGGLENSVKEIGACGELSSPLFQICFFLMVQRPPSKA